MAFNAQTLATGLSLVKLIELMTGYDWLTRLGTSAQHFKAHGSSHCVPPNLSPGFCDPQISKLNLISHLTWHLLSNSRQMSYLQDSFSQWSCFNYSPLHIFLPDSLLRYHLWYSIRFSMTPWIRILVLSPHWINGIDGNSMLGGQNCFPFVGPCCSVFK